MKLPFFHVHQRLFAFTTSSLHTVPYHTVLNNNSRRRFFNNLIFVIPETENIPTQ